MSISMATPQSHFPILAFSLSFSFFPTSQPQQPNNTNSSSKHKKTLPSRASSVTSVSTRPTLPQTTPPWSSSSKPRPKAWASKPKPSSSSNLVGLQPLPPPQLPPRLRPCRAREMAPPSLLRPPHLLRRHLRPRLPG
ncbi:hypothetical protein AAZX31_14G132300 [Glycine max]